MSSNDERTSTPLDPELHPVEERLVRERPVPRAGFRSELRALIGTAAGPERRRVRRLIAAYAGSGALLLAVAIAGTAGVGPLAAG
jgi:hypothetical protein